MESGGKVFIDAKSNGTLLTVAPGKSAGNSMPAETTATGMQLFTGDQSADRSARCTIFDSSVANYRFDYPQITPLHFYMK